MAAQAPPNPATIQARYLPGWMPRAEAIRALTEDCVPAHTPAQAEEIWNEYRQRAEALANNRAAAPNYLPLNAQEQAHAQTFMQFVNAAGPHEVVDVVKVDLRDLIAHQYYVITERATEYGQRMNTAAGILREFLPTAIAPAQTQTRFSLGMGAPQNKNQLSSYIETDVPHAEFAFLPVGPGPVFAAAQFMRHVTACVTNNRVLLKAGYHRSFARIFSAPIATVPTAVIALERNTVVPPPNQVPAGGVITAGLTPFGGRCALLRDFFTDGLFMNVLLKRKRYQLQIQSTWTPLDA
jgi:hypothetical protein